MAAWEARCAGVKERIKLAAKNGKPTIDASNELAAWGAVGFVLAGCAGVACAQAALLAAAMVATVKMRASAVGRAHLPVPASRR